jgi:hypothetical protein
MDETPVTDEQRAQKVSDLGAGIGDSLSPLAVVSRRWSWTGDSLGILSTMVALVAGLAGVILLIARASRAANRRSP